MKKRNILLIPLLIIAVVFFYAPTINAATISSGNTYASTDGTSGRLVINSVNSSISGSTWNVSISYTINMVNSYLYTGGSGYYRYFSATINGVGGGAVMIKTNLESWSKSSSHSFTYSMSIPVDPNNNIASARFTVTDGNGSFGDVATFDTGAGNTVTLQAVQKATGLTLNISNTTLYTGQTAAISPSVSPSNTYNSAVSYSSSNVGVASVSASGVITALKAGSATITVTTADGSNIARTVAVTVKQYVSSISVDYASHILYTGETISITASTSPNDASDMSLSYTSSDPSIAIVSESGIITALKAGNVAVTVTALDRSTVKSTIAVTVLQKATILTIDNPITCLYTGETHQILCTLLPIDTSNKAVTYSSSDLNIADVSASGLIFAKTPGTTTISVATADGSNLVQTFLLTVKQYVTSITTMPSDSILYTADTLQLDVETYPSVATDNTLSFISSNPDVAEVDSIGLITAMKAGTTTIIVTATDRNTITAQVTITVKQHAEQMTIDNPIKEIYIGESYQLSYSVLPTDTTDQTLNYTSSDFEIATIDAFGIITPVAKGTTTITAVTNDGSNLTHSFEIEVLQHVTSISADQNDLTLYTGEDMNLSLSVLPNDASNQKLIFTSSDENIVKINHNGKVSALKAGTVNITVSAEDGSNVSLVIPVTVKQYAVKISVGETIVALITDSTYQITPSVYPADTTDPSITYESSDTAILTVDENGLVSAHAPGSANVIITASNRNSVSEEISFTIIRLAADIVITQDSPREVTVGSTISILASIIPADASNQALSFTSSDESIATVNQKGVVKGIKEGTCTITIGSTDGTDIEKIITINVKQLNKTTGIAEKTTPPTVSSGITKTSGALMPNEVPSTNVSQSTSILPVPTINRNVVRNVVLMLGAISLLLLIAFRKLWFAPLAKDDEKEEKENEK